MVAPELLVLADRLGLKATRFEKTRTAETIERMHLVGPSKQDREAREQQRHREHVLLVVTKDRLERSRVTLAKPREVAAPGLAAGQVVGAMQVEHTLLDGLQRTVRQTRPKDAPRQRQQVEMRWRWPLCPPHDEPGLQEWPVEAAAVVAHEDTRLVDALAHGPEQRLLLVEVAEEVLGES